MEQPTSDLRAPGRQRPRHAAGTADELLDHLRSLSGGGVVDAPPSGPTFAPGPPVRRDLGAGLLVPVVGRRDQVLVAALSIGWASSLVMFWVWWLQPAHRTSWAGLVVNSAVLAYLTLLPAYFLLTANRVRRVDPRLPVPLLRVAFVVTKAPSEPWAVARRTLRAMCAQRFPYGYDVWLCDEDPTTETLRWCHDHGIGVSSRRGVAAYHRDVWPRRTRCKEGNLAFFYDRRGYRDYDVVAQLDCDHVPGPDYLAHMVRPFGDPAVGYVAAPSVCDQEGTGSWSARGRLHREAAFHGAIQAGHSAGLAPVCIGSHYAVRTEAVARIGGIGPELAEDFSTAFLLNSAGWQGVFALDADARGDGPLTVGAMLTQEFQWSRSLTTLLLDLVPRHLGRLPWRLRVRFFYALVFYSLLVLTTTAGLLLPPVAAVTGMRWVQVDYVEFLLRWWLLSAWLVAVLLVLRRNGLLRPRRAPVLSWENWLYALARWPYVAWGVVAAVGQRFRPRSITFRVTPKAHDGLEPLPVRIVAPYATFSAMLSISAFAGEALTGAVGYVGLCLLGAVAYATVTTAVAVLHGVEAARSAGVGRAHAVRRTAAASVLVGAGCWALLAVPAVLFPFYVSIVLAT
ncbi:glycosyltransferase family 2 protein [Pseudonocardia sp. N23]|uniref:glycosyltransferase family 2 protein n=1 Tax=Pseudonocardia sp. N23 TaxID=1987376 RepID=UPI000BFC0AF1|nr:glycosyltransferase family 2 protein [Pseudonocardia sp. N23]GAY09268.1 cellulose synthase catalytic subunit [Pseudonocardia sp. N23]